MQRQRYLTSLFLVILIVLSTLLFFPFLGNQSLASWDEAWYAEIARNIVKTNNWFLLKWNGLPYYDHPPLVFWLMTISFKLLGVNELSARLPSALTGLASVLLIYLVGKNLFSKTVGFFAGVILATTPWFWLRSREGNLDIILTFFSLLAVFSAIKVKQNQKYLFLLTFSFACTLLSKTVIGIGLLPVLIFLVFPANLKTKNLIGSSALFFVFLLPWYFINYQSYGLKFIDRNIFVTGLKIASFKALAEKVSGTNLYLKHNLYNLQMGILLWYKPFIISALGSLFFIKKKSFQILMLWLLTYVLFFFSSNKTELWHFIIIYPAIALTISAFIDQLFRYSGMEKLGLLILSVFVFWFGVRHVKGLYRDIVKNQSAGEEVILSRLVGQYYETVFIDDDYWPTAVFYSGKKIYSLPHSTDIDIKTVNEVFKKYPRPFLLLTKKWILDRDKIPQEDYEILKQIGNRVLVRVSKLD